MPTFDLGTSLVVLTSLSQIGVLSFLLPHREQVRLRQLEARYPSSEYPLAYTITGQKPESRRRRLQRIMWGLGVIGIAVLLFGVYSSYDAFELGLIMYAYMLVQILPWVVSGPRFLLVHRALRNRQLPAVRHAELRPRRVTDYVSARQIAVAFGAQLAFAATCVFAFPNPSERAFLATLPVVLINIWLALRIVYRIRGFLSFRRTDPYMSVEDRHKVGALQINSLMRLATVFGLLSSVVLLLGRGVLHFDRVYVFVAMSLLIQLGFLRLSIWLQNFCASVDFSAYRDSAPRPAPNLSTAPSD